MCAKIKEAPMPINEVFSRFINDFGESVTIAGQTVTAIVDVEYFESNLGLVGQEATQPQLTLPTATIPSGTVEGTTVVIRTVPYKVRNIQPDGTGMSTIMLI
jgi:hypothetical protein